MEALRQRVKDLDVQRRELTVRDGKNWLTLLLQNLVAWLRDNLLKVRHLHQFDVAVIGHHLLDQSGLQKAVKRAAGDAGVTKAASCHTFRHSFATHLLARVQDICTIQEILCHRDVSTTMVYTHVLNSGPSEVRSPADLP